MSNKENRSCKGNTLHNNKDSLVKSSKCVQTIAHQQLQHKLVKMHQSRDNTQAKYENVIASLEGLMRELLQRNDCLVRNRQALLREQIQLKKKNGSLNAIIEAKLRLSDRLMNEDIDIFDIIVESACFSGEQSQEQESDNLPRVIDATSQIFQRNELAISSIPLSYNMSVNQEEISMSNIGPTINQSFRNTNLQKRQSIYVQCSNLKAEGIIRAFYLSAIQRRQTTSRLSAVIESLKNDIICVIYEPYPNNQFWTQMLSNFLKILHEGEFDTQVEILEYLKAHRLIDSLIIKCLRTRIEFLFDDGSFETRKVLTALANEFGMKMQIMSRRYLFFLREEKEYNLLYSQEEQSEGSFQSEREEPCFVIVQRDDSLHIPFFIEPSVDREGLSSTQIKEVLQFQQNLHGLRFSGQNSVINGSESERTASLIEQKAFNSTDGGRRLKRTVALHDSKQSNQSRECLQSSRFFLNRVCSKKSDLTDMQY